MAAVLPVQSCDGAMREGDTLFLAMDDAEILYFIVAPGGSPAA